MSPGGAYPARDTFGPFVDIWAKHLWQAVLDGGLTIFVVWMVCRLLPRPAVTTRHLLWRLVYCKLLIGLFQITPLPLPVLPPGCRFRLSRLPAWR